MVRSSDYLNESQIEAITKIVLSGVKSHTDYSSPQIKQVIDTHEDAFLSLTKTCLDELCGKINT